MCSSTTDWVMQPAVLSEENIAQIACAMSPAGESAWSDTEKALYMQLARRAVEAVISLGSPIPACADVETVCREHISGTDEIRPGVSALVFRQGAELVRRTDMEAQIARRDDRISVLTKRLSAKTCHYVDARNDRDAAKGKIGVLEEAVNSLTQECDVLRKEIARLQKLALPVEMSPDIAAALGIICFQAAPFAAAFRSVGENIPRKAEAEQAFVIFRLLRAVLAGGNFDQAWRALVEDALAAQEQAEKDRFGGGMS